VLVGERAHSTVESSCGNRLGNPQRRTVTISRLLGGAGQARGAVVTLSDGTDEPAASPSA